MVRTTMKVKDEPQKMTVAEQVLAICKESPEGVQQGTLAAKLPHVPLDEVANALNYLLKSLQIQLYKNGNVLSYRYLGQEVAVKFKGLSSDELLVYQIIKGSNNIGIWTRDLKVKSNLQQNQVVKVLKVLESRKLVKAVKSVQNKNRKVYMDFDTEPAREVTGGAWYTENEFDHEFIVELQKACNQYVHMKKSATVDEIKTFIRTNEITTVELTEEDVKSIMNILVYDGELDEKVGEQLVYIPAVSKMEQHDLSIQILEQVSHWPRHD